MFKVGDFVVYKRDVCKIIEIKKNHLLDKDYYTLVPIDDNSLTINIPVENKMGYLRKIISISELKDIVDNIHNIDIISNVNDKEIEQEYKKLLVRGTHQDLIKIIKTTYLRNKIRIENNKKIGEKDNNYFKIAERILYNEFSIVLNKSYDETKDYVVKQVERNLNRKKD